MNKQILVLLLVLATIVSISSASAAEINLCEKAVNIGGSWGVCDPMETSKVQGIFGADTNTVESTEMDYVANVAAGAGLVGSTSYTLIYYKDTDPEHVLPSTVAVNGLGTAETTADGALTISGTWSGGDIPSVDDVNPRGKIWIVPTSEINGDGTLKWTGYGQGNVMVGYLFESDLYTEAELPSPTYTVQDRMGGIRFNDGIVTTSAEVVCPTVDLSAITPDTSISEINPLIFMTTATLAPVPTVYPQFKWYVDDVEAGTDSPIGFTSSFDASTYNVNDGLVTITKTVRVDARTLCTGIDAETPADSVESIWEIEPQIKSIEVDVNSISFGGLYPGGNSDPRFAVVKNTGNVGITVHITASNLVSGANTIPGADVFISPQDSPIIPDGQATIILSLHVPSEAVGGTYVGTLEFATS